MDCEQYDHEIRAHWPQSGQCPSKELVDLCLKAVTEHPESSVFWYDLGIIMQRCDEQYGYTAKDYLRCFENSVRLDPEYADAQQELGFVLDTYFDEYEKAEEAFKIAIELGAEHESYFGLARVLAQMGKTDEAIASLSESDCPFYNQPDIQELRAEILHGGWYWYATEKGGVRNEFPGEKGKGQTEKGDITDLGKLDE